MSRDPLGETGRYKLYLFVNNNAMFWWDYLGLDPTFQRGKGATKKDVKMAKKLFEAIKKKADEETRKILQTLDCVIEIVRDIHILFKEDTSEDNPLQIDIGDIEKFPSADESKRGGSKESIFLHEVYEGCKLEKHWRANPADFDSTKAYETYHQEAEDLEVKVFNTYRQKDGYLKEETEGKVTMILFYFDKNNIKQITQEVKIKLASQSKTLQGDIVDVKERKYATRDEKRENERN